MALDPEQRRLRGRVAILKRHFPDRPELWADGQRELRTAAAARYIAQLVDNFPAPTPEQRARLAELLAPVPQADTKQDAA
jgi:hypothetical protein